MCVGRPQDKGMRAFLQYYLQRLKMRIEPPLGGGSEIHPPPSQIKGVEVFEMKNDVQKRVGRNLWFSQHPQPLLPEYCRFTCPGWNLPAKITANGSRLYGTHLGLADQFQAEITATFACLFDRLGKLGGNWEHPKPGT
eukprot:s4836_g2.t1